MLARPYPERARAIRSLLSVQSARRTVTRRSANLRTTCGLFNAKRSFTWQLRHHFAEKSMKTGVPWLRSWATLSGLHASQEDAARAVVRVGAARIRTIAEPTLPSTSTVERIPAAIRDVPDRAVPPHRPQIHAPKPVTSSTARSRITPAESERAENTKIIQSAAAIIGKPMTCLKVSIHFPGFGRRATRAGK